METEAMFWVSAESTPEDEGGDWTKVHAFNANGAVEHWIENDPDVDSYSDHFDAFVREDGSDVVERFSVRLEYTRNIYVTRAR